MIPLVVLLAAAAIAIAVWLLRGDGESTASPGEPAALLELEGNPAELKQRFNANADKPRVLVLVSST